MNKHDNVEKINKIKKLLPQVNEDLIFFFIYKTHDQLVYLLVYYYYYYILNNLK